VTAPVGGRARAAGVTATDTLRLVTTAVGTVSGNLTLTSNAIESPTRSIAVSGTVLRHAVASLDSLTTLTATTLDLGTHASGGFTPATVRVHDRGYDALQARLNVSAANLTGGAGRFTLTGVTPQLVAGTAAAYTVAFDDAGATAESTYTATLAFTTADEPLPGATAAAPLTVTLQARVQAGTTDAGPMRPTATVLRAPSPNPLVSESMLRFELATRGAVRLDVYDAAGRRVAGLLDAPLEPGRYSVRWNGRGENGAPLGAGLYFARLTGPEGRTASTRIVIVR
jgi:hypothetical protein